MGESRTRGTATASGRVIVVLATLAALLAAGGAHARYTVELDDTLDGIARRHGTTVAALTAENGLADPGRIVEGATLRVPHGAGVARVSADAGAHHVVRPGETLSAIAGRYGVPASRLAEWNGLPSRHLVLAGQRLSVSGPAASNVATSGGATHLVAFGETLSGIAQRRGVALDALARANGIGDPDVVRAGSTLTLPGGWHCPVAARTSFVNDFGIGKPGGRFHDGVDLFAPRGTTVVAPVAGRVEHATGSRAGLQFRLLGVDGHTYIGTHLDSLASAGDVRAGEPLGVVGTTGNARGTSPHLHFEIHAEGYRIVNPYPSLRAACG